MIKYTDDTSIITNLIKSSVYLTIWAYMLNIRTTTVRIPNHCLSLYIQTFTYTKYKPGKMLLLWILKSIYLLKYSFPDYA